MWKPEYLHLKDINYLLSNYFGFTVRQQLIKRSIQFIDSLQIIIACIQMKEVYLQFRTLDASDDARL